MADIEKLIELILSSEEAFSGADRSTLSTLFDELSLILADCDGMGFEVIDALWQGCRQLQQAMEDDEISPETLAKARETLFQVSVLLVPDDVSVADGAESSARADEGDFVIPADDIELIEDFIVEGTEHLEAAEGGMLELEEDIERNDALNLVFRAFHTIKGMAGFMNLQQIGQLTHNAETLLDLARKGSARLIGTNADAVYKTIDMLKGMIDALRTAVGGDRIVRPYPGVDELSSLLQRCVDGSAAEPSAEALFDDASAGEEPEAVATAQERSSQTAKSSKAQIEETIKVKTSRLDNLINMVGELVIAQLMVSESLKRFREMDGDKLSYDIGHQGKLIRELQELSTSMRMVPINGIFQKMARMSRDLSRQAGKSIRFSMQGEQTELDRTLVDRLSDPLVHMIRNSVDHGIEAPGDRIAAGKDECGNIELRAFHAAGNIVIELEDDGKGLDRDKLFDKGSRMGIFQPGSSPSEAEIFNVIFTPGLSTAEKVTKVSGRGVGMDVVKRNIENLRGRIDIQSAPGEGTVFTITLPLTLAIIDGQVIRVGDERYIVPINVIRKSFRPTASELSSVQGRGEMVNERGQLLPLVRLHELFGVEPLSANPEEGLVVVVEQNNSACGLLVDDLLDQQQVVIKNLGGILSHTPGISGGAIMGNGQVSLILDIPGVIKISQS